MSIISLTTLLLEMITKNDKLLAAISFFLNTSVDMCIYLYAYVMCAAACIPM